MERLASHFLDKNFTTEAYWIILPVSNAQLYTIQEILEEGIYAKETFFFIISGILQVFVICLIYRYLSLLLKLINGLS